MYEKFLVCTGLTLCIVVGFLDLDVTDEDIKEIGADPETLARFPEEDGGGYVMTIEYTHQLHCLVSRMV